MKKRFAALLLAAAAVVSLAGCGQTKSLAYLKNIKASDYVELSDDYSHVTVEVPAETEVTDEMVENTINYKLSSSAAYQEVTDHDTVKKGDTVNIDYTGTKDGKEFSGGSAKDYDLTIGSGSFIDGFEDGLIGHKKGENVTLNLTFPKDYSNTDLAGQDVVFKVTINKIEKLVTPELTDEWVAEQNIDGVSTVDEFRDYTKKQMQSYYDDSHKSDIQEAIVKKLLKSCTFVKDPPAEMVQRYYDNMVQSYSQQLSQSYGIDLDTYTKLMGLDDESSSGSTEDAAAAGTEQAAAGTTSAASEASSAASGKTDAEASDTAVTEAAAQSSSAVTSEEVSSSQSTAASIQDIISSDSSSSDAAQGSTEDAAASASAAAAQDSTESAATASTEAASDSTTVTNASETKEYKWIRDDAVEMAKRYIILQAIADKENLNLTTRELKTELSTEAAKEGYSDLDTYLKDEENSNSYREYLMSQRVLDWLVDHATVKTLSADESADNASDESSSAAATENTAADETAAEASTVSTEADTKESSESSEIGDSGAGMGY
ncbi:MAG: trigger factor [Lachnospiraceae bacterium]|nr:trigger factor [Lachnospiraceae bacterium]